MPPSRTGHLACTLCSRRFSHKSSLVRHSKRCSQGIRGIPRQKSCLPCASAKVRCDLARPVCHRCQNRAIRCAFVTTDNALGPGSASSGAESLSRRRTTRRRHRLQNPEPPDSLGSDSGGDSEGSQLLTSNPHHSLSNTPLPASIGSGATSQDASSPLGQAWSSGLSLDWALPLPDQRRRELVGNNGGNAHFIVSEHTRLNAFHVSRVLTSWPRLMANLRPAAHLPPPIHQVQFRKGVPPPLARCYTLVKMWIDSTEGSLDLIHEICLREARRLLDERTSYDQLDLIAAAQSLLILVIMLILGSEKNPPLEPRVAGPLLVDVWDMERSIAATGLILNDETTHTLPSWESWALVEAKRRTVFAFHHLEWSWSILNEYPTSTCFGLIPLPAPEAGYLWRERDEATWEPLYQEWLRRWAGGSYRIGEFLGLDTGPSKAMDDRSEMWLAEADEYGMLLMSGVNVLPR